MKAFKVLIIVALTNSAAAFACAGQMGGTHNGRPPQGTVSFVDGMISKSGAPSTPKQLNSKTAR